MMFAVGDIVAMYASTAGKTKYHLCVCAANQDGVEQFLFINSGDGYEADYVLTAGQIACLPNSPTGKSVISCSMLIRRNQKQLAIFKSAKLGELDKKIAASLALFISTTKALTPKEKAITTSNLDAYAKQK